MALPHSPAFTLSRITSIGWLYGVGNTIVLTPCLDGCGHPTRLTITAQEFAALNGDISLMRQKAASLLA